jgi:hypothetical protein
MQTQSFLIPVYAAYATLSVALTIWLARTLFHNGAVFLDGVFDDHRLAEAVNRLLVVGFYLVNLGYACLLLKADASPTAIQAVETLAWKLGLLLLSLGAMHFANLYLFHASAAARAWRSCRRRWCRSSTSGRMPRDPWTA